MHVFHMTSAQMAAVAVQLAKVSHMTRLHTNPFSHGAAINKL